MADFMVDCGAHHQLCAKIKATCDAIHEYAPNHPCGCATDADGTPGNCETGV